MRVSLEWLGDQLEAKLDPVRVARQLTMAGLEVESVEESEFGPVLDVAVTPNRGDCLSIRGFARELATLRGESAKHGAKKKRPLKSHKGEARVSVQAKALCTRYCGQLLDQVTIAPSPDWLRRRIEACGIRSINNVVDATNYVMLETGQPLHAFDLDRLADSSLRVRRAQAGETIVTIDGKERRLVREDLVIADANGPVALAGVMGGHESEVHAQTTRLFLESACFDSGTVRRTSKRLGLSSESSYRFERGVDWYGVREALERLISLLTKIAGARECGSMTDIFDEKPKPRRINLSRGKVESILGISLKESQITQPLKRLGCQMVKRGTGKWSVEIPSFRRDVNEEIDLIEEVARIHGFDSLVPASPVTPLRVVARPSQRSLEKEAKRHLCSLGFTETIHYSFANPEDLALLGPAWNGMATKLANPLSQDASLLRPTLLLALLQSARYHHHRQMTRLRLFEMRTVFRQEPAGLAESRRLAGLMSGDSEPVHWSRGRQEVDFFEAKGVMSSLLDRIGLREPSWAPLTEEDPYSRLCHPGKSAGLLLEGRPCAMVGELHPRLFEAYEMRGPTYIFEIDWQVILDLRPKPIIFHPFSVYPLAARDLALVVDEGVAAEDVRALIARQEPDLIREVELFDVYRGKQVPAGKKSLAFTFRLGRNDRTLTEDEVQGIHEKIMQNLKKELQAEVR